MKLKLAIAIAALLAVGACAVKAGGPPEIELDRTACSHCGMLISESLYAAAYQAPGAPARVFDDIGCLRDAARGEAGDGLHFWFHDGSHGGWIEGSEAIFVASPEIRTPMGGGLIAYRDRAAAERSALATNGRIVESIAALLSKEDGS
jgi:copper chaperone NosL